MDELDHDEYDFLTRVRGLFIGQLDDCELRKLYRLQKRGHARIVYEGPSGMLGLGKIEAP